VNTTEPTVISAVFAALDIGEFTIQLNHRKLLRGYFEGQGIDDTRQMTVLREIDKLDKRGEDAVRATLTGEDFGLSDDVAERLLAFSRVRSTGHDDALARLDALDSGVTVERAADILGVLNWGTTWHQFIQDQGWSIDECEIWLNETLIRLLLKEAP
jgi:histidyl-tRNA synthetase